ETFRETCQQEVRAGGSEAPKVALTFDDGPHSQYTPMLLDGLKERGVKATFFIQGQNIEGNEEILKRIQKEGHLIGNHTFHHVRLYRVSEAGSVEEMGSNRNAMYELPGMYTALVRPRFA